jgi:carbon storage regulator
MLVLTRRVGEEIVIDGGICIKILAIDRGRVRIGIIAPAYVRVDRQEVHELRAAALAKSAQAPDTCSANGR